MAKLCQIWSHWSPIKIYSGCSQVSVAWLYDYYVTKTWLENFWGQSQPNNHEISIFKSSPITRTRAIMTFNKNRFIGVYLHVRFRIQKFYLRMRLYSYVLFTHAFSANTNAQRFRNGCLTYLTHRSLIGMRAPSTRQLVRSIINISVVFLFGSSRPLYLPTFDVFQANNTTFTTGAGISKQDLLNTILLP